MPSQAIVHDPEKRNPSMDVTVDSSSGARPESCLSVSHGTSCASSHESCDARDSDPLHELLSSNPAVSDIIESRQPTRIASNLTDGGIKEDIACDDVSVSHCQDSCSVAPHNASSDSMGSNIGMVTIAKCPVALTEPHAPAACERGDLISTVLDVAPESSQIMPEASGASSSYANIMHSDDENVKECEKGRFRDLEAGLPIDAVSSLDEEGMLGVDKCPSPVESTREAVPVEADDDRHPASSCDVKDLVDSKLREPLLTHVQTDDTKSSQGKEFLLSGENKLGGESLEKETEVHGLRARRAAKADAIRPSTAGDSGPGKMPEEQKKGVTSTRTKDASTEVSQEAKQKPVDKKSGKQGKGAGKPSAAVKNSGSPELLVEESRAKEEAETNRKVHESLDNFIRQTIRCEPYMNFTSRPGDKPLQRLRPDVFENHVAGKLARGFNVQNGPDPRDIVSEENRGVDSNSNDIDGSKDGNTGSAKGIAGLTRGAQHSLKVPPGVVAFTQAAAKGTDLQGWLPLSKTKCDKCAREFCSTLNYRRHYLMHRRIRQPEKEDLSKERPKVAAFWDKLNPELAGGIVHYANMEIEGMSGQGSLDALQKYIQKSGLASGVLKTGSLLFDIVQNGLSVPLSSERLLAILDDASEKTFLCGGTSTVVQRLIFSGEDGVAALDDKNVVAFMGFHVELKLVKAWMVDKEAEALRSQQALLKEEEAAQQKRRKLMEKKRQKKIRQKERKGSTGQKKTQNSDNESIDDESNVQGIGEEDDSPTGTGSSASSLASAQDLALPESAELDETDVLAPTYDITGDSELVLGEKSDTRKNMSSDEDQLHRSRDALSQYGREGQQIGSHRGEGLYTREDPSSFETGAHSQPRSADQVDWDGDLDSRAAHPSYQSRSSGKTEVQTISQNRKGEQDRIDSKRRDFETYLPQERRLSKNGRDKLPRNDNSEQKSLRDSRGSDTRYGDSYLTTFKSIRKPTSYFTKSDSGNADLSTGSRLQQYRSKPPGMMMNRASSTSGNQNVVWTKKMPQPPAAVEAPTNIQEETIHDYAESATKVIDCPGTSEALSYVASSVRGSEGGGVTAMPEEERMEEKEDAAAVPLAVVVGNVITNPGSYFSSGMSFHIDVQSEDCPGLPQEDIRLAGSGDYVISTEEIMQGDDDEDLTGAVIVGSLSVPLGKFATASLSQKPNLVFNASYRQQHADDFDVINVRATASHGESHGVISFQEAASSSKIHTATGSSSDGSELLKASTESRSNPVTSTQQGAKSKSLLSSTSPERGENSRLNAAALPLGNERLAVKPGSWQTSAGRYVPAKVWRAVVVAGERPDSIESRHLQGSDASGRSEGEEETSPKESDVRLGGSPTGDNEFLREDTQDRDDPNHGHLVVMKTSDDQSIFSASSAPFRPAAISESGLVSEGKGDYISETQSDKGVEYGIAASGQYSLSDFVEDAKSLSSERWRVGLAHAAVGEVLQVASDFPERVGFNFLNMLYLHIQMSKNSSRQSSGAAESWSSSSSSVISTELASIKLARDGAAVLSKVFNDSEQTGVEDVRCPSTVDEEARDEASPQAPYSEVDVGMRDVSTSPIGSEHDMSGSEMASSAPSASGENLSESRGGGVCSSYPRRGNSRQERWHRHSRDRFSEQRYMARRRAAPVEKKDS